jgi:hypothetical protein
MSRSATLRPRTVIVLAIVLAALTHSSVFAQPASNGNAATVAKADHPEGDEAGDFAKQLSNPIANLVSIPFQFNWQGHVAPFDSTRFLLNFQPVVPFTLNDDWNLIARFIFPFLGQPAMSVGGIPQSGTSDITFSLFFSPSKSKLIWGVGPALGIPTTTNPALTSGKWSAGPTGVVLRQDGPWTVGALVNQLWSYASVANYFHRPVNQMFLQPFVAYQMEHAVTLTVDSESTFDWQAESGQKSTVPIIVLLSKVTKLGPFPFSVQGGGGYYVERPDGAQRWLARLNFVLILPREHKKT